MILLPLPFKLVTCAKAELPKVLTVYHQAAKLGDVCNPLKSLSPVTPAIFFLSNCLLRIVSRLCRTSSVLMLIHSSYSQEKRTFTSFADTGSIIMAPQTQTKYAADRINNASLALIGDPYTLLTVSPAVMIVLCNCS